MNPFEYLDQDALLEALTEYYAKYREVVERTWDPEQSATYHDALLAILSELNKRQGYDFESTPLPRDFKFERKSNS